MAEQKNAYYTNRPIKRFFSLLSLDRKEISYLYIYAIFAGLISLSLPLGIQAIINFMTLGQVSSAWVVLSMLVALGIAFTGAMKYMQISIAETLSQRVFARSTFEFAYRVPRLKLENIKNQYAPELANRFFDTITVQKGLPKIVMDLSASSLEILFGLLLLALYHPFFVFFGIVLLFFLIMVIWLTGSRGIKTSLQESKLKYKVAYWLQELGRTMSSFKLAGRTKYPLEKSDALLSKYLSYRQKHFRILVWQFLSTVGIKSIATLALLLLGGMLVMQGELNVGQFVAAEIVILQMTNSIEKVILTMETIFDVLTGVEKIGAVTDLEIEDEDGVDFTEIKDRNDKPGVAIQMNNLSYTPKDAKSPILRDINIEVKSGERLCIAGYSGSGTTTLLRLMLGLYEDFEGSIIYNGMPRKNINIRSLRSYMGDYLTLEHLFNETLEKNISMGRTYVSLQDIIDVCDKVGLTSFVRTLPKGFDTKLNSDGDGLPQSVIKKILLARCIVDHPLFVGLETLLNNMETKDKMDLIHNLTNDKASWTLAAVSKNPIFAKNCDRIIILKEGRIIDEGTYEEIRNKPYFSDIFDAPEHYPDN